MTRREWIRNGTVAASAGKGGVDAHGGVGGAADRLGEDDDMSFWVDSMKWLHVDAGAVEGDSFSGAASVAGRRETGKCAVSVKRKHSEMDGDRQIATRSRAADQAA